MAKLSKNKYLRHKSNKSFVKPSSDQMESWLKKHFDYKTMSDQFRICNPDGDSKYCMAISRSQALVHDFRPGHQQYDGTFIGFISKYKNISIREAIDEVCKGVIFSSADDTVIDEAEDIEHEIELPAGSRSLRDKNDSKLWKMNVGYLVNRRGLDYDVIIRANIHYLGTEIIVPYYQYGVLVFYQSRQQMDKRFNFPKSTVKKAGDFLYGFDNVEPHSEVIIVESIYNSLSIGDGCVATGGASLKPGQLRLLKALAPKDIILAADNDEAGRKSICKDFISISKSKIVSNIYYCLPPFSTDQMDWNDMKQRGLNPKRYIHDNKRKMSMKVAFEGISGREFK